MKSKMLKAAILYQLYSYVVRRFKQLIYNVFHDFLADNHFLSPNQPGLRSDYSCINHVLSINHGILNAFDKGFEVRGISKTFDKV